MRGNRHLHINAAKAEKQALNDKLDNASLRRENVLLKAENERLVRENMILRKKLEKQ
jgi:hypothetical protein